MTSIKKKFKTNLKMLGTEEIMRVESVQKQESYIGVNNIEFNEFDKLKKLITKRDKTMSPEDIEKSLMKELKLHSLLNRDIANVYVRGVIEGRGLKDGGDFLPFIPVEYYKNIFFYRIEKLSADALMKFLSALSVNNWFNEKRIIQMLNSDNLIVRLRGLKFALLNKTKFYKSDIKKYGAILGVLKSGIDIECEVEVVNKWGREQKRMICTNCLEKVKIKSSGHCTVCNSNKIGFVKSKESQQPYFLAKDYWDIIAEIENRVKTLKEVL